MDSTDMDHDDTLSEMHYEDDIFPSTSADNNVDDVDRPDTDLALAPMKRRREANDTSFPDERKKRARRKLFSEDPTPRWNSDEYNDMVEADVHELKTRPTIDRFVYGNEIVDLRSPLPGYEGASVILTNVYNTFIHIVQYKSTLEALKNRKLAIQLRAAEHHMRQLEANNYEGAHVQLPRMLESLFSMLDHRNNPIYINQIKPISCVLNRKFLTENISYRSMEAKSKNDSNYIELMFNNPFRFIFVGCAKRGGEHDKNQVSLHPFFGEYMNKAINDMYDVLYNMVSKEIAKAKKEFTETNDRETRETADENGGGVPQDTAPLPNNSLQMIEAFSNSRAVRNASDSERLRSFLRLINLPLAKRENVDILPTSGNSSKKKAETAKMNYLTVENDKEKRGRGVLKMVDTDVTEDAVYMSSYIRCRVQILDQTQAAFRLQIYTRHAIKLLLIDDRVVQFKDFVTADNH